MSPTTHTMSTADLAIQTLTTIRTQASPYLPPPVLSLMETIDTTIYEHFDQQEEGFMLLFVTFLIIVVLQRLIVLLASSSRSSASTGDDAVISGIAQDGNNNTNKQHYKTVLLCGPVGAGKTMLFQHLSSSSSISNNGTIIQMTLSSMIASQGTYVSNGAEDSTSSMAKDVHIVDYPGHARLRSSLLSNAVIGSGSGQSQLSLSLSGIIFVLDSTRPNMAECADLLYDVLLQIQRTRPASVRTKASFRVLICCNKSDMKLAKNEKRIQLQLKTELNRLRGTRGAIESTDNGVSASRSADSNNASVLGKPGVPLDWSMDGGMPCEVSFVSCSCLYDNNDGLKGVRDFIEGVC